jgi:hypothetical protein
MRLMSASTNSPLHQTVLCQINWPLCLPPCGLGLCIENEVNLFRLLINNVTINTSYCSSFWLCRTLGGVKACKRPCCSQINAMISEIFTLKKFAAGWSWSLILSKAHWLILQSDLLPQLLTLMRWKLVSFNWYSQDLCLTTISSLCP